MKIATRRRQSRRRHRRAASGDDGDSPGADIDAILGVQASPQREARNRASDIPLQGNPRHSRRPSRRLFVNALRAKSAAEALAGLPADGETWHCLMTGDFDSFDLVPAMLDHARIAAEVVRDHLGSKQKG